MLCIPRSLFKPPYNPSFTNSILKPRTLSTSTQTCSSIDIEKWKHPTRGGQNLTLRYQRLEKSLRGKEAYGTVIADLTDTVSTAGVITPRLAKKQVKTFMGFVVPEVPKPPADDECCMSGCAICVHDLYQEALEDYNASVTSVRDSLQSLHVPEERWPESIRVKATKAPKEKRQDVRLNAFEELERRLKAKHESEVQVEPLVSVEQPPSRRRTQSAPMFPDLGTLYEGFKWIIFSNR